MRLPLTGQLTLADALTYSLRHAYEQFHRQPDHSPGHVSQCRTALCHWERCTHNPAIGTIDNSVMHTFRQRFISEPLPSKVDSFLNRCRRLDPSAMETLRILRIDFRDLAPLSDHERYQRIRTAFSLVNPLPDSLRSLLPSAPTFNAVRASLEAILGTLGPKTDGNPFSLGLLPCVPRCRPAIEDDPLVVIASKEELTRIYEACSVATWPSEEATGVAPPLIWRALEVYLYNVASRRGDFEKLRKDQIDLEAGVAIFRQSKTKKARALPLHQNVIDHFRAIWHSRSELVFPFPRNRKSLYATWRKIQRAAGIHVTRPASSSRHDVYGFHELRKTSLGEYFTLNESASQLMGCHSSMQIQMRHYIAAAKKDGVLRRASEALPQPAAFCRSAAEPPPLEPQPPKDRPRLRIVG